MSVSGFVCFRAFVCFMVLSVSWFCLFHGLSVSGLCLFQGIVCFRAFVCFRLCVFQGFVSRFDRLRFWCSFLVGDIHFENIEYNFVNIIENIEYNCQIVCGQVFVGMHTDISTLIMLRTILANENAMLTIFILDSWPFDFGQSIWKISPLRYRLAEC